MKMRMRLYKNGQKKNVELSFEILTEAIKELDPISIKRYEASKQWIRFRDLPSADEF